MRKNLNTILILPALLVSISLSAQQTQKPSQQTQSAVKLLTAADTAQYSIGAFVGQWINTNGFKVTNQTLLNRGIDDVLQGRKLAIADTIIGQLVASYQLSMQNERSRQLEEQLFASLKGKAGVGVLPNGVHYMVVKAGTGIRPIATDTVEINAIGVFPDGTLFEDTYQKKQIIRTTPSSLIPGLNETIQLMTEGSEWRVFIPSILAYGTTGIANVIPPNMALVFEIRLEKVVK